MKLEDQVCSLELAKKLKELGVKQDSLFDWVFGFDANKGKKDYFLWLMSPYNRENLKWPEQYSAFTVAELGEMLPYEVNERFLIIEKCFSNLWQLKYSDEDYLRESIIAEMKDENEANARAKLIIHLIENKLIEIPS